MRLSIRYKKVSKAAHEKPYQIEERKRRVDFDDYINVVIHVFQKHKREYYIENLGAMQKLLK